MNILQYFIGIVLIVSYIPLYGMELPEEPDQLDEIFQLQEQLFKKEDMLHELQSNYTNPNAHEIQTTQAEIIALKILLADTRSTFLKKFLNTNVRLYPELDVPLPVSKNSKPRLPREHQPRWQRRPGINPVTKSKPTEFR